MVREKGQLLAEGKTKRIWEVVGDSSSTLAIVEYMNTITAFDDPSLTRTFNTKATYSNATTCRVFELLRQAGIPVAYQEQLSDTEFLALNCKMIRLEAVARRYPVGSYLKRHPEFKQPEGEPPLRFHNLRTEFFLKTTAGGVVGLEGQELVNLDPKKGEEDPLIVNPYEPEWRLFHSKKPSWDPEADLKKSVASTEVIGFDDGVIAEMDRLLRRTFYVLESAWNILGLRLIDFKIEFGFDPISRRVVVADVIDNDSWRLRDPKWKELSKEVFRQGGALQEVEENYGIVAKLTERFRIPRQALVIWKGSEKDETPTNRIIQTESKALPDIIEVVLSGHKSTAACLRRLDKLMDEYPEGGVIVTKVGRSNGLGPILASHTTWLVVATPATIKEFPEDIWSSVRMPSSVPLVIAWPDENAIMAAMNVLSMSNPALYMVMQEKIEELDQQ